MTLPYQRTQTVVRVQDFLRRLASPYGPDGIKKVPTAVREEARRLLKHYPFPGDLLRVEQWDKTVIDAYYKELAKTWGAVNDDAVSSDECCG